MLHNEGDIEIRHAALCDSRIRTSAKFRARLFGKVIASLKLTVSVHTGSYLAHLNRQVGCYRIEVYCGAAITRWIVTAITYFPILVEIPSLGHCFVGPTSVSCFDEFLRCRHALQSFTAGQLPMRIAA